MSCGALEIVGHCPVIFVAVRLADHVGYERSDAAELCVAERIGGSCVGQEFTVSGRGTFGDHDHAETIVSYALLYLGEKLLFLERHFGEQDYVRWLIGLASRQPAGCGNPAGMAAHDLEHEYLGGGPR